MNHDPSTSPQPTSGDAVPAGPNDPDAGQTEMALELLSAGVPLSLLLDLATTVNSHQVYDREPGDAVWLSAPAVP